MNQRVNPAAGLEDLSLGDLSDFAPRASAHRTVSTEVIDHIAKREGFPSRAARPAAQSSKAVETPAEKTASTRPDAPEVPVQAAPLREPRRYTTGRNQQINIKATAETIERLQNLAMRARVVQGELLRLALDAYERELSK